MTSKPRRDVPHNEAVEFFGFYGSINTSDFTFEIPLVNKKIQAKLANRIVILF